MKLDCSKIDGEENDAEIRRFRRKTKKKLKLGEMFKIYNEQGYQI
jgi:hypothetical protein